MSLSPYSNQKPSHKQLRFPSRESSQSKVTKTALLFSENQTQMQARAFRTIQNSTAIESSVVKNNCGGLHKKSQDVAQKQKK